MRKLRLPFSCSYFAGCEYYTISPNRVEHVERVEWGVALTRDHEKTRKLLACLWPNRKTIGRHWVTRGKNTKAIGLPLVVPEALECSWVFVCRNVPNLKGCSWVFVCCNVRIRRGSGREFSCAAKRRFVSGDVPSPPGRDVGGAAGETQSQARTRQPRRMSPTGDTAHRRLSWSRVSAPTQRLCGEIITSCDRSI